MTLKERIRNARSLIRGTAYLLWSWFRMRYIWARPVIDPNREQYNHQQDWQRQ